MSKQNQNEIEAGLHQVVTLSDGTVLTLKRLETVGEDKLPGALYRRLKDQITKLAKLTEDRLLEIYADDGVTLYSYVDTICRAVSVDSKRKLYTWQSPDEYLISGFKTWLSLNPADLDLIAQATAKLIAPVEPHKLGGTNNETASEPEKKETPPAANG